MHCVDMGGNRTQANAKSVGRCSAQFLEGAFQGQCTENQVTGSWFSFPSAGECAAGWDVGFNGCTWKTTSSRVVEFKCVADRCERMLMQEGTDVEEKAACLRSAFSDCPDFR